VLPLSIAFVERHFVARHQIVPAASSSTPELNSQRNLQVGATFVKQLIKPFRSFRWQAAMVKMR
jgi:hypothetical protein